MIKFQELKTIIRALMQLRNEDFCGKVYLSFHKGKVTTMKLEQSFTVDKLQEDSLLLETNRFK